MSDTKTIPLTHGHVAIVDADEYERLSAFYWHVRRDQKRWFYAQRTYWIKDEKRMKTVQMHREIMGFPEGKFIDHINGDGLDNRKANLRVATPGQNVVNSRKPAGLSSSRYKGVRRGRHKWEARIKYHDKSLYLGSFATEEEAARAYAIKAIELHGEFAHSSVAALSQLPTPSADKEK